MADRWPTDGRQQHELRHSGLLRRHQGLRMRPVVYGPGVPGHAGARGQAGPDCIETFSLKAVARQRRWVADITEAQRRCAEQPGRVAR